MRDCTPTEVSTGGATQGVGGYSRAETGLNVVPPAEGEGRREEVTAYSDVARHTCGRLHVGSGLLCSDSGRV